ncbi:hypothetical protein CIL05_17110 [Virgibacillus profundi]|uniref:PucR family transcriptional regulator n=1 Tax=Virgibacillus profundi TaxID=2024555 RepID=A0A2A2IBA9_9BACI|nr:PucR family transcriptional regulator [Virgibacillus profundi]PAV28353.1 hypothetical protein CIL05_17110 [Virgibacillus profundi]PXY52285.1 PucR family transcriptional regulator [Virgibacillus profundi]
MKVRDIMEMDEMNGAYFLAGSNGRDRIVKSTTVLDAPDGIRFLKGTELVFSTMYPFSHLESGLELIIQDLALRNVSGLGLKLNRYISKLPDPVIKIADEYKFPIISLPPEKSWADLMLPIMSEILKINNRQLIQSKEVNHQFTKMLLSNSNLQQVAELLYHYMEAPVGIFNFTENYAVFYPNSFMFDKEYIIHHLKSESTFFEEIDPNTKISTLTDGEITHSILSFENHLDLKGAILVNKMKLRIDSEDINTLLHAKNASILKFMHLQTEKEFNKRFKQDFVSKLIVQNIEKEELSSFRRRAWEMGFELKSRYILMAMTISNKNLADIYRIIDDIYLLKNIKEEILIGMDKENHIIFLIPMEEKDLYSEKTTYVQIIDAFVEQIKQILTFEWAIGISRVQNIHSIPLAYNQAVKSLYHGIKIGGYRQVQYYDNLGIYRLFSHPALEGEMKVLVKELLGPLVDNDIENQTELVETLRVFVEHRGNYRKTAEVLHVHHNTVRYRINSICELTNFDVHNNLMHLQYQLVFLFSPLLKDF